MKQKCYNKNDFQRKLLQIRNINKLITFLFQDVSKDSELEVIFVSSDHSAEDMMSYITESHGHWLAVEHGSTVAQVR